MFIVKKTNIELDNMLMRISKYLEQEVYKNYPTREEALDRIIKIAEIIKR